MQLIRAAAVVRVDQAKLRGVFTFDLHHIAALETNQVLLEAASFLDLDALLDCGHRSPTNVTQTGDEMSLGNERITRTDAPHRSARRAIRCASERTMEHHFE